MHVFSDDFKRKFALFQELHLLIQPALAQNWHFGPNILIFKGVSKSFGTNITENHLDNLSALFFGQALDKMCQKC